MYHIWITSYAYAAVFISAIYILIEVIANRYIKIKQVKNNINII